jgi:hypothetical protein
MFKVSFKETPENPSKLVQKLGKITTVTVKGTMKLPDFWNQIPPSILQWVEEHSKIEIYEDMLTNSLLIYSEGKAKCLDEDKYDSVLGERIAESKAMIKIYDFVYKLSYKLFDYYNSVLFGDKGVVNVGSGWSLERAIVKHEKLLVCESKHLDKLIKEIGK